MGPPARYLPTIFHGNAQHASTHYGAHNWTPQAQVEAQGQPPQGQAHYSTTTGCGHRRTEVCSGLWQTYCTDAERGPRWARTRQGLRLGWGYPRGADATAAASVQQKHADVKMAQGGQYRGRGRGGCDGSRRFKAQHIPHLHQTLVHALVSGQTLESVPDSVLSSAHLWTKYICIQCRGGGGRVDC